MPLQILLSKEARAQQGQLRRRLKEVDQSVRRLQAERSAIEERLRRLNRDATVSCPKCGRASDFLTDNGGYLGHVLEDPADNETLEPGKPLYCPDCGDVFLYRSPSA